jgi:hypothetical protein
LHDHLNYFSNNDAACFHFIWIITTSGKEQGGLSGLLVRCSDIRGYPIGVTGVRDGTGEFVAVGMMI